jgi:DNA-binding MarR family transcriptional regulator/GNAT superfamily N-acetyltransferase
MTEVSTPSKEQVADVRAFNRFYTRQIGLLEERLHKSAFSLTEARVLYELAHRDGLTATDLGRDLGLDAGYLSRLLKKFESRELVTRAPSPVDARQSVLSITEAGREAFAPLDRASREEVASLLGRLSAEHREAVVTAMQRVQRLLGQDQKTEKVSYRLRPLQVGDIGWIVYRQGVLYAREYGWDESYEALAAEILAGFVKSFDPECENAWIAEREGEVVGSVFLMRKSVEVAKLRLLYVEPSARGLGIGRRLVDECVGFARTKGYKTLTLWTNDVLVSARRIYQAAGFQLAGEERHRSFGKDLVGQTWDLAL